MLVQLPWLWLPALMVASALAVACVRRWLLWRGVMDVPTARGNHAVPTPRGGGIGLFAALLPAIYWLGAPSYLVTLLAVMVLLFFADDRAGLSLRTRLGAQCFAMVVVVLQEPSLQPGHWWWLTEGAGLALLLVVLLGVWWMNATNFLDGIDGMAGMQQVFLGLGVLMVAILGGSMAAHVPLIAAALIAASLGFLWHNWHPARIFLGDAGSVPLGLLSGYLLLHLIAAGWWIPALILPAYYAADVGITLLLRAFRRERLSQAHSAHAYQRAVRLGAAHDAVVVRILGINAVLLLATLTSLMGGWQAVVALGVAWVWAVVAVFHLGGGWSALRAPLPSRT